MQAGCFLLLSAFMQTKLAGSESSADVLIEGYY